MLLLVEKQGQQAQKGGHKKGWQQKGQQKGDRPRQKALPQLEWPVTQQNICKFYNEGNCRNTFKNCVKTVKGVETRMHHKCSYVTKDADGKESMCLDYHAKAEAHKSG